MNVPKPEKAILKIHWQGPPDQDGMLTARPDDVEGDSDIIELSYNPKELSFSRSNQYSEINIPGLDAPIQQFVRGQSEKLDLELFFDTTQDGMGEGARSVTTETDKIYSLTKINPDTHAPPVCEFFWNADTVPGANLHDALGSEGRNSFVCFVEKIDQRFTLFSPEGVPLRATLNVTLREYKTLARQLDELNLNSPDKTQAHVTRRDDSLSGLASRHYQNPNQWRRIARANDIDDPRRLSPGRVLRLPPVD